MSTGSSKDTVDVLEVEHREPFLASSKIPAVHETETTPLLLHSSVSRAGEAPIDNRPRMSPRTILIIMGVLILFVQSGQQFQEIPFTRIKESIYCYQYWEQVDPTKILISRAAIGPGAIGGVEEHWCKVAEVQGKVAMLQGTSSFLSCIPSFFLSIPLGILADRYGRKPILLLGLISFPLSVAWELLVCWFWQSFNLRAVWFSSVTGLLGGGSSVTSALFFVVLSDVTNQENRSTVLLRIFSANLTGNLLCPPIVSWIMTINPLISVFIAIACLAISVPICLSIPETLGFQDQAKALTKVADEESTLPPSSKKATAFLQRCYQPLLDSTHYFSQDKRIIPLVFTFIPVLLTNTIAPLLLQYTSTRYSMNFSKSTLLLTVRAGVTIAMFLVVQPWIYHFLSKSGMSGAKRDLLLARGSAFIMLVGWLAISFSPNIPLFVVSLFVATIGGGIPVFLRSFLTDLVEPNRVAELYTIIGIVDNLGLMAGYPLLAWLFKRGMKLGGAGIGLPFMTLASLYGAALVLLLSIGHHKRVMAEEEDARESEE